MHDVKSLVKVKLTKNQLAAITSFVEDRGIVIFKNSRLLKAVTEELAKWVVDNGRRSDELVLLRQKEITLFSQ
jgi:GH24 family phage-related lysozyme (muramidase)